MECCVALTGRPELPSVPVVDAGVAGSGAGMGLGMEAMRAMPGGAFPLRHVRRADARLLRIERWGVGLLVAVLHLLLAAWVQRLLFGHPAPAGIEPAMQLVYVSWLPRAQAPSRTPVARASEPEVAGAARTEGKRPVENSAVAERAATADAPLNLSLAADDRWTANDAQRDTQAAATRAFHRRNPVTPPPPERFRWRSHSPADIVRMVSMGLFWPPGYSDDPCAGVSEAIESFSRQAANERHRRMLADAVLQRNRYCPP